LKEQLEDVIARHEQIAEEIERAFEPDGDAVSSQDETSALSSETPADNPGAPPDPHLGQPGAPV
jgi:hypothetical protein